MEAIRDIAMEKWNRGQKQIQVIRRNERIKKWLIPLIGVVFSATLVYKAWTMIQSM